MNWKLKCLASHIIARVPHGNHLYDFMQQHFTGRWTRPVESSVGENSVYRNHIEVFRQHYGDISGATYFEFGVARDLFSNLVNYCYGIPNQIAVDLYPLARPELVNHAIKGLRNVEEASFMRRPMVDIGEDMIKELIVNYGIDYRAPYDACKMDDIPDGSIDLIASTATLEHIPPADIRKILDECYRVCHSKSILSMSIDYSDHYSHGNMDITPYNFLKYTERQWKYLNMPHYYVNRLRHSDHVKLIEEAGFEILEQAHIPHPRRKQSLEGIRLAPEFQQYAEEDLLVTAGTFTLRKKQR